ncbi:aminotransferase class IV [Nocardioides conyzicola]|uniref:Aminodeoxychorismate lyase n=1 Tax=Nocardioides conyzicola TaxID=1651781 RepID=A0ABP8XA56_9ACTN
MTGPSRHSLDGVPVTAVPPELALYPYGAFTTFVAVDGEVLAWGRHEDRLARSAAELWGQELDRAELRATLRRHLDGTTAESVRVSVYPAELDLAAPASASGCRVLVSSRASAWPIPVVTRFRVRTTPHRRELPELKSTSLLMQIKLRRESQLAAYDDALFVDGDRVLEGTTWSVVLWQDGVVVVPDGDVLPSITADVLVRVADRLGWRREVRELTVADLAAADLVLAVNANNPARAISEVDGCAVPVDADLLDAVAGGYRDQARDPI